MLHSTTRMVTLLEFKQATSTITLQMTTEVASVAKETTPTSILIMFKAVEVSLLPLVWIIGSKVLKFKMTVVATERLTSDLKAY